MLLFLTQAQGAALSDLLNQAIADLGYEISAADDNRYRADLIQRRQTIHDVADALLAAGEMAEAEVGRHS